MPLHYLYINGGGGGMSAYNMIYHHLYLYNILRRVCQLTQVGRQVVFEVQRGRERRGRQQGGRGRKVKRAAVVRVVIAPEQVGGGRCAAVEHERCGGRVVGHAATGAGAVGRDSSAAAAGSRDRRHLTRSQGHQFHGAFAGSVWNGNKKKSSLLLYDCLVTLLAVIG